jgi:uncharacterized membrane protein
VPGVTTAHLLRWNAAGEVQDLGVPQGYRSAAALGVSPDGSVIVGSALTGPVSQTTAFVWTEASGFTLLSGTFDALQALGGYEVSNAGVVVGTGTLNGQPVGFVWDAVNGVRELESLLESQYGLDLQGTRPFSAFGISADGTTIVGTAYGTTPGEQFGFVAALPEPALVSLAPAWLLLAARRRRR